MADEIRVNRVLNVHRLVRKVRFSVNPFSDEQITGANSYAGKPCGEGLSLFFELTVGLAGQTKNKSGFVLNVTDIDKTVRHYAVPVITDYVKKQYQQKNSISIKELTEPISEVRNVLKGKLDAACLIELGLSLNPYRKMAFDCEDMKMFYFSEKFDFAAMHKLWNDGLSERENFELFGKCANPNGHGHNYVVEVTIKAGTDKDIRIGDFENTVDGEFIMLVDHKNLNMDVEELGRINPTIENIAAFAWKKLNGKFGSAKLHSVTVWESDRTFCTYYG